MNLTNKPVRLLRLLSALVAAAVIVACAPLLTADAHAADDRPGASVVAIASTLKPDTAVMKPMPYSRLIAAVQRHGGVLRRVVAPDHASAVDQAQAPAPVAPQPPSAPATPAPAGSDDTTDAADNSSDGADGADGPAAYLARPYSR